jgi:ubiquinone biosynthesis protein UbiJ
MVHGRFYFVTMILSLPLIPFIAAINHLLAQEPWARDKLAAHAGKTASFDTGIALFRFKVAKDGSVQAATDDDTANVTIRMRPADLPLILQDRERAFSHVRVEGDADFANVISQLSQSLKWEAEADLSRVIGDVPATRLVSGIRAAADAVRITQRKLAENMAEYLLEENPMLVRPQAVSQHAENVARLRDDVERLAKRIEKLERRR